jgi:hypothetical protein
MNRSFAYDLQSLSSRLFQNRGAALTRLVKRLTKPIWAICRDLLSARTHVIVDHLRSHGNLPDFTHPKTFNEKIAFRKLYDRDPRIPALIDKLSAKQHMAARFGSELIVPTLAVFEEPSQVKFAALPYPCVIKANHASGFNIFLHHPPANEGAIRRRLAQVLRHRHHRVSEEWGYAHIHPSLFVEPWLGNLIDYKLHTFAGRVFAVQVDVDRFTRHARAFFDPSWARLPVALTYPRPSCDIPIPRTLVQMLSYAEQIGAAFSYLRVDLYEVDGKVKFGEATFYPGAGLERFNPSAFDLLFGAQWNQAQPASGRCETSKENQLRA